MRVGELLRARLLLRVLCLSQEVDIVFAQSLHYFPNSAQLHVFIAQYIRYYHNNEHLELMHLSAADVRVYQCP